MQQSGLLPSKITSNDLLRKIEYPGNPGGIPSDSPVTTFAYNLAGEVITLEDPNATEHDYTRDLLGRVGVAGHELSRPFELVCRFVWFALGAADDTHRGLASSGTVHL